MNSLLNHASACSGVGVTPRRGAVVVRAVAPGGLAHRSRSIDAGDEAASGEAGPSSPWRAFDAAATCFFLDVASDLLGVIATLRRMLAASRGVWANLGPLAYPDAPFEAMGGHAPPPSL